MQVAQYKEKVAALRCKHPGHSGGAWITKQLSWKKQAQQLIGCLARWEFIPIPVKNEADSVENGKTVIYVAGNPSLYPLEYYDPETETYQGAIPAFLEQFAQEYGYTVTYYQPGHYRPPGRSGSKPASGSDLRLHRGRFVRPHIRGRHPPFPSRRQRRDDFLSAASDPRRPGFVSKRPAGICRRPVSKRSGAALCLQRRKSRRHPRPGWPRWRPAWALPYACCWQPFFCCWAGGAAKAGRHRQPA